VFTLYDAQETPKDSVAPIEIAEQFARMCAENMHTDGRAIGTIHIEKELCRRLSDVEIRVLTIPLSGSGCHNDTSFASHNAVQQQSVFSISKTA
jgi:hypothetical protein